MKTLVIPLILLILTATAIAQDMEYGDPSELRGKQRVRIDVGTCLDCFNVIREEIEKAKLELVITQDDGFDVLLGFTPDGKFWGTGLVALPVVSSDKQRLRIVLRFNESRHAPFEAKPARQFAQMFVKAYKKANSVNRVR